MICWVIPLPLARSSHSCLCTSLFCVIGLGTGKMYSLLRFAESYESLLRVFLPSSKELD